MTRVLTINPGSTSTKVGVFDDERAAMIVAIRHEASDLDVFERVADQAHWRLGLVLAALEAASIAPASLDAVAARGGLCRPIPGGTYGVDEALLADLTASAYGEHASNLGAPLAWALADLAGVPAFIVDPVVVDELDDVARFSGHPAITRRSVFHALNHKAVARRYAAARGRDHTELDLIVAHLGGGISVGAHHRGRVIDVNNALDGDGPFAPERAGGLPTAAWAALVASGRYEVGELRRLLAGRGGLMSLLGTNDLIEVADRADAGDARAVLARDALAYQVAKEIGSAAAVLHGRVDAILLTGGVARDPEVVDGIRARVAWIAPVELYPGEDELPALRDGALRVLRGQEQALSYGEAMAHAT